MPSVLGTLPGMTSLLELERIAALGWRGTETATVGEWLLRAGHGFTGRANSVLPLGSPGANLDDALAKIANFYRDRGQPIVFQIPEDSAGSQLDLLDRDLQGRGWLSYNTTVVLTASIATVTQSCPPAAHLPPASFAATPSQAWLSGYRYRGDPLPASAVAVLVNACDPVFATVIDGGIHTVIDSGIDSDEGPPAGVARGVLTQGWLGVTAVTVAESRRRSGIGRHLMGELARWALERSEPAHSVYLQVDEANSAAIAMYDRVGFVPHHRYHYLRRPLPPPA